MNAIRLRLAQALCDAARTHGAELSVEEVVAGFSAPPRPEMGEIAFGTFPLARALRKAPPVIATLLAEATSAALEGDAAFSTIQAAGPYVNVALNRANLARETVAAVTAGGFGDGEEGAGRVAGIDYSAPNIAKPFGIGHLRSTVIGHSLKRLLEARGWTVVGVNHLGDWGTQFGKLMAAFTRWGDRAALEKDPIQVLYALYVEFHKRTEEEPELVDEGRAWFRRLESGDPEATALWEEFRALSLQSFETMYKRLGVTFDQYWGEAFYNDKLEPVIEGLERKGLLVESEGAQVVPLDDLNLPPCLVRKSDGATLYATRDLAAAIYRHDTLNAERFYYVVGAAQAVHFQQVFAVLERMGHTWASELQHVPFGLIQGISTRKGTLVFLEDVLDRGRELALEKLLEREGLDEATRAQLSDEVAVGAIVFYDLMRNRTRDYAFSWEQMMDWNGRTGPYLQYTHVRLGSVKERWQEVHGTLPDPATTDWSGLEGEAPFAVVRQIARFPDVVRAAAEAAEPSEVARYLLDLAEAFNTWYSSGERIVTEDAATGAPRIQLAAALQSVLGRGLYLLGVPVPERM